MRQLQREKRAAKNLGTALRRAQRAEREALQHFEELRATSLDQSEARLQRDIQDAGAQLTAALLTEFGQRQVRTRTYLLVKRAFKLHKCRSRPSSAPAWRSHPAST